MSDVSVRRGDAFLLDRIDWTIRAGERWVVIGPNGAGKTTLLQVAAAALHPTSGVVEILGERLGEVDVFELRPRIGMTSAAFADRLPPRGRVLDVVLTSAYATTRRPGGGGRGDGAAARAVRRRRHRTRARTLAFPWV